MSKSHKIMADALIAIAAVGRGWGTTGEGHARCVEIANKALTEAEHADMEAAYQAADATPSQRLDAATVERCAQVCEEQAQAFLSPQYATGQPSSSFAERFAAGKCAEAIRSLLNSEKSND